MVQAKCYCMRFSIVLAMLNIIGCQIKSLPLMSKDRCLYCQKLSVIWCLQITVIICLLATVIVTIKPLSLVPSNHCLCCREIIVTARSSQYPYYHYITVIIKSLLSPVLLDQLLLSSDHCYCLVSIKSMLLSFSGHCHCQNPCHNSVRSMLLS